MDKRILEYLENPAKKNIQDYSLYSGDAGMTIVYYLYARHLKDEKYSMKGLSLLDIISDNLQDDNIRAMHKRCDNMSITFTPTFFLSQFQLPEIYTVADLKYFLAV